MNSDAVPIEPWIATSRDEQITASIGAAVGRACRAGDVVALVGDLGAGKTCFVRGLAAGLNLDPEEVSSPTFVLVQEYSAAGARLDLVHMDAYRLEGVDDIASIGWHWGGDEMRRDVVTAIEWSDRLAVEPDGAVLEVHLDHVGVTARRVVLTPFGSWRPRMAELAALLETVRGEHDSG